MNMTNNGKNDRKTLNNTKANKNSCALLQSAPHFFTTLSVADIPALPFTGTAATLLLSRVLDFGPGLSTNASWKTQRAMKESVRLIVRRTSSNELITAATRTLKFAIKKNCKEK